ncbi:MULTISPECIES: GNAT family N-acetyltransferase [unclassified Micromonospora]|uniref:GNAT family N-acetyltransferase n=1 Tax=unclassified Micromonospora TaxID=2617518 RepID=UPI0020B3BD9C|nr:MULTISPECIES: GNAT family N-acetyltransferase [unclassified Micromonospora]MDM4783318.1 GNAT family N-acetyltransferase [Micromonospora sp. b486]
MEMDEQIIAVRIRKLKQDSFHEYRDELIEVYEEVYAEQLNDPFFSSERYWSRLRAYAARDGFRAVAGEVDGTLIGYALGYTLPAETRWWQGLRSDVDAKALVETGTRTFALNEIMVRKRWRRRGIARQLHNSLIEEASEERATLLVLPDNVAAQAAYRSWGWQRLGELQPFDDAPVYDSMILDLTESQTAAD